MRDSTRRHPRHAGLGRLAGMVLLALSLLTGCSFGTDTVAGTPVFDHTVPAASDEGPTFLPAAKPTRLRIPAITVDAENIVDLGLNPDRTMEVPQGAQRVGWYSESPTPGELGPSVLAAHVDWKNEKGVFYDLRRLSSGDEVIIDRADGTSLLFEVELVERYRKDRFPTSRVYGDVDRAELRLITCGGVFDSDAQSYEDNVVAYAKLVAFRR
ncbi:class F sortase [Saccharomonospora saliphila]|uniref:class F sortase n=1 Tax=Saccharomonospora saliphila TaxID=369829 RepID=UPI0003756DC2|nr:class F sortase [Saccharomonospora saliphila]